MWWRRALGGWRGTGSVRINYGIPHTGPRTLLLTVWPLSLLEMHLSLGLLLSNDALLLCCFCKSPLFIQFCRRLLPYGRSPRCLQTVICSEGRDVTLIAAPPFVKPSDKVVTFSSAGPTFFFVIRLQLEREQNCSLVSFPFIASYCNEVELEERGGAAAVHALGNIKTDSAPCARSSSGLLRATINQCLILFLFSSLLRRGFTHYWLVLQLEPQHRSQAGLAWTPVPKWGKR